MPDDGAGMVLLRDPDGEAVMRVTGRQRGGGEPTVANGGLAYIWVTPAQALAYLVEREGGHHG